jgi:ketosteroid isomerase-like protein
MASPASLRPRSATWSARPAELSIAEGDFVTAYGDMTMKDKDGKVVPYAYCDIYRFRSGKIVELRAFVIKTEAQHQTSSRAS